MVLDASCWAACPDIYPVVAFAFEQQRAGPCSDSCHGDSVVVVASFVVVVSVAVDRPFAAVDEAAQVRDDS